MERSWRNVESLYPKEALVRTMASALGESCCACEGRSSERRNVSMRLIAAKTQSALLK